MTLLNHLFLFLVWTSLDFQCFCLFVLTFPLFIFLVKTHRDITTLTFTVSWEWSSSTVSTSCIVCKVGAWNYEEEREERKGSWVSKLKAVLRGLFCLSVVADIMKIMHSPFFCFSVFISVCVFNVWPKTTLLLQVSPETPKGRTPLLQFLHQSSASFLWKFWLNQPCFSCMVYSGLRLHDIAACPSGISHQTPCPHPCWGFNLLV